MRGKHKTLIFEKPLGYWITAMVLILLGLVLGRYVDEHDMWLESRYWIYRMIQKLNPHKSMVQATFVVKIDDNDFWKGDFDRRSPIRRDVLAKLIEHLADAQAKVIAVDFDLRSPDPDGNPRETPAYQNEDNALRDAISRACAHHHAVVLPATIDFAKDGSYVRQSDIYADWQLPTGFFTTGYIALPDDARIVPLELSLSDSSPLDSFSLAAVKAYKPDPELIEKINGRKIFPFGGYLPPEKFVGSNASATASEILKWDTTSLQDRVGGKIVLIGSTWHRLGWNIDPLNDSHLTPIGNISGVFVHANYIEAILGGNNYPRLPEPVGYLIEATVLLMLAVLFATEMNTLKKAIIVLLALLSFMAIGIFLLQNLGIYFDFFIPVVFLLLHVGADEVIKWRQAAIALEHRKVSHAK